jgi:hypothetical protein
MSLCECTSSVGMIHVWQLVAGGAAAPAIVAAAVFGALMLLGAVCYVPSELRASMVVLNSRVDYATHSVVCLAHAVPLTATLAPLHAARLHRLRRLGPVAVRDRLRPSDFWLWVFTYARENSFDLI